MNGVVAILTDFGSGSNYVGVMKGVLLGGFPDCKIVDLFNDVKPQSIREGSWILSTSCSYFPHSVKNTNQSTTISLPNLSTPNLNNYLFIPLFNLFTTLCVLRFCFLKDDIPVRG